MSPIVEKTNSGLFDPGEGADLRPGGVTLQAFISQKVKEKYSTRLTVYGLFE